MEPPPICAYKDVQNNNAVARGSPPAVSFMDIRPFSESFSAWWTETKFTLRETRTQDDRVDRFSAGEVQTSALEKKSRIGDSDSGFKMTVIRSFGGLEVYTQSCLEPTRRTFSHAFSSDKSKIIR